MEKPNNDPAAAFYPELPPKPLSTQASNPNDLKPEHTGR